MLLQDNRYLRINPENAGEPVAIRVKHVASGTTRFIGEPFEYIDNTNDNTMQWAAEANEASPVFRVWDEGLCLDNGDACNTSDAGACDSGANGPCEPAPINVFGCIIVPSTFPGTGEEYEIQAIAEGCDLNDELNFSDPLTLFTTRYGDVFGVPVGPNGVPTPPNNSTDTIDALGILQAFRGDLGTGRYIYDIEPEVPDRMINILDVLFALEGFQGIPYIGFFSAPQDCP